MIQDKKRIEISPDSLSLKPYTLFNDWMLLTCGDYSAGDFNTMTIAWGSMGIMWYKPLLMVVVRPNRYTYEFMERYDNFTVSSFDEEYRDALTFCGKNSGRDIDKIKKTGLTPVPMSHVSSPGFDEAKLIIECVKMYTDDFKPERFLNTDIESYYPAKDYHRMYFGEVCGISMIES